MKRTMFTTLLGVFSMAITGMASAEMQPAMSSQNDQMKCVDTTKCMSSNTAEMKSSGEKMMQKNADMNKMEGNHTKMNMAQTKKNGQKMASMKTKKSGKMKKAAMK